MRNSPQQGPRGPRGHRPPEGRGAGPGRRHRRRSEGREQGPPPQARRNRRNRPLERSMDNGRPPRWRGNRQRSPQANFRPNRMRKRRRGRSFWNPPIELTVFDDRFEVLVELPGVSQDNIDVSVTDRFLKVEGEKQRKHSDEKNKFRRSGLKYGKFKRVLPLPPPANADGITAKYKDGILSIVIPKSEDAKSKHIPINADA
ncbi:MAG: Hsp20/alpha crystallin family protein [Candidatus Poribacteria bacterium]|nr:Hsp20/alpha crystallin family protein [Candidatus Poribacteria bacterium]